MKSNGISNKTISALETLCQDILKDKIVIVFDKEHNIINGSLYGLIVFSAQYYCMCQQYQYYGVDVVSSEQLQNISNIYNDLNKLNDNVSVEVDKQLALLQKIFRYLMK